MAVRQIKMSDAVTAKLKELAAKAKGTLKVGFIDNDQAPIAFWNEFGHKGRFPAPARPFFRNMVDKESPDWPRMIADELKRSGMDGAKTLNKMGQEINEALKQSIRDTNDPPLSLVTRRLRYKFGQNTQDIRARDVIEAQRELAAVMIPTKRGTMRQMPAMVSGTGAKPLIWTKQMINSTSYEVDA